LAVAYTPSPSLRGSIRQLWRRGSQRAHRIGAHTLAHKCWLVCDIEVLIACIEPVTTIDGDKLGYDSS
jgi:hypothetical protein